MVGTRLEKVLLIVLATLISIFLVHTVRRTYKLELELSQERQETQSLRSRVELLEYEFKFTRIEE